MNFLYSIRALAISLVLLCVTANVYALDNKVYTVKAKDNTVYSTIPLSSGPVKFEVNATPVNNYTKKDQLGCEEVSKANKGRIQGGTPKTLDVDPSILPGSQAGWTYYDLQTNASMANRIIHSNDGGTDYFQILWMADDAGKATTWANRGTFYEAIDATNINALASSQIWAKVDAPYRTGWPSIISIGDNKIATAVHDPGESKEKLVYDYNDAFGSSPFKTNVISAIRKMMWPRTAIDNKGIIHVVFTFNDTSDHDRSAQIGYVRSEDKGATWSTPIILTGPIADYPTTDENGFQINGNGADSYAITAKNGRVVIIYYTRNNWVIMREINDGGALTQPKGVMTFRHTKFNQLQDLGGGMIKFASDTTVLPGQCLDLIIDNDNKCHFVASAFVNYIIGEAKLNGDGTITRTDPKDPNYRDTTWGYPSSYYGLLHVKESGDSVRIFGNPIGTGVYQPNTTDKYLWSEYANGYTQWPQLGVDKDNNIYCVYTGIQSGDTKSVRFGITGNPNFPIADYNALCGHTYVTMKPANETSFKPGKNLTPAGVDCSFATLCDEVPTFGGQPYLVIAYQADNAPGNRVNNAAITQDDEKTLVMMAAIPASKIDEVGVEETITPKSSIVVSPNPISDLGKIIITNENYASNMEIAVYDLLGNKLVSLHNGSLDKGTYNFNIYSSGLNSGVYYISMASKGEKISKIINVIH